MSWLTEWPTLVMDWFKGRSIQENTPENPAQRQVRRPREIDTTENLVSNDDLLRGLWRNTYPGTRLSGALTFAPIFIPVAMMGIPVPTSDDPKTQELLDEIVEQRSSDFWQIHRACHHFGTIWIWPSYYPELGLVWEFINDSTVTDLIKDLTTGELREVVTNDQLLVTYGENDQRTVVRKRHFTREKITVTYSNSEIPGLAGAVYRNIAGVLPVPFSNEAEPGEVRGVSDLGRILPDLKNYHDIDLAWTTVLSKFKPKLALGVADVEQWLKNNGYTSINDVDVPSVDVLFYVKDKEDPPELIPPPNAEAYDVKLQHTFHKIVESSAIPEIVWGLKTQGNHASVEEQMGVLVQYVRSKQRQKVEPYRALIEASLRLLGIATINTPKAFDIDWNKLDAVSDAVKSEIFARFASGMASLFDKAGITMSQAHRLWELNFPEATEEDYDEFVSGVNEMAKFRQFSQASFADVFDVTAPIEQKSPEEQQQALESASSHNGNGHHKW